MDPTTIEQLLARLSGVLFIATCALGVAFAISMRKLSQLREQAYRRAATLEAENAELRQQIAVAGNDQARVQHQLDLVKGRCTQLTAEKVVLEMRIQEQNKQIGQLNKDKEGLAANLATEKQGRLAEEEEVRRLRALLGGPEEIQRRIEAFDVVERQLAGRRDRVAAQEKEIAPREERIARLEADEKQWRDRLSEALRELARLNAEIDTRMHAEGLLCPLCWRKTTSDQARYIPIPQLRRGPYVSADDLPETASAGEVPVWLPAISPDRSAEAVAYVSLNGFSRSEALTVLDRPEWREWIKFHHHRLNSTEKPAGQDKRLAVLFEMCCPEIHDPPVPLLPAGAGLLPIVGESGTGKTIFTVAALDRLRKVLPALGYKHPMPNDESSLANYNELHTQLFVERQILATNKAQSMIFRLEPRVDRNGPTPQVRGELTLFLKDVGGEYWRGVVADSLRDPLDEAAYLVNADSILFVIDPTWDPLLSRFLKPQTTRRLVSRESGSDPQYDTVNRILLFLRKAGFPPPEPIPKTPLIVISKADCLSDKLMPPEALAELPTDSVEICAYLARQSAHVEQRLRGLGALPEVISLIEGAFARKPAYFMVSALGYTPEQATNQNAGGSTIALPDIRPRSVELPVLWQMCQRGLIG